MNEHFKKQDGSSNPLWKESFRLKHSYHHNYPETFKKIQPNIGLSLGRLSLMSHNYTKYRNIYVNSSSFYEIHRKQWWHVDFLLSSKSITQRQLTIWVKTIKASFFCNSTLTFSQVTCFVLLLSSFAMHISQGVSWVQSENWELHSSLLDLLSTDGEDS